MTKSSRYSRAQARAKYRKPKARRSGSTVWGAVLAVVVVLGIGGIVLARAGRHASADVAPRANTGQDDTQFDHWHAFLGVDVCGTWMPNAPKFENQADSPDAVAGLHSHGDGLMHIHPWSNAESGNKATVGRFIKYGGWQLSGDKMKLWDAQELKNGDKCPSGEFQGREAFIVWSVNGKIKTGNPADFKPDDRDIVAIGFLPKGVNLPEPPDAKSALANISDLGPASSQTIPVTPDSGATGITIPATVPATPSS